MPHILALDEGTTSARAIVFTQEGEIAAVAQREFKQILPQPGHVEHDPEEIWSTQIAVAVEALSRAGLRPRDLAAVGITNQRETVVIWNRKTGKPIHNAIVWQDRRTAPLCEKLRADGCEPLIQQRTGLLLDPYFSATKIAWLLDNIPNARAQAERGELAFGTIDTWLAWKLTSGHKHVTDPSNASRTLLFNIQTNKWDDELLKLFNIPRGLLPEVVPSSGVIAGVSTTLGLASVPLAGIAGDQQAALFGQLCTTPGLTKCTYGTGCFALQFTGPKPSASKNRLLSTIAWNHNNRTDYCLEGSVFIGGAAIQWLRDGLHAINAAPDIDALASSVPDSAGLTFVPAFTGLGAPHWDPYATGAMLGITRGTTTAHIARATLEGIALQVTDLLDAIHADTGVKLPELRVDGGAANSNLLMQIQADLLGVPVVRPKITETTALGAAYLAGLAVKLWKETDLTAHWKVDRRFEPQQAPGRLLEMKARWQRGLQRAGTWYERK